MHTAASARAAEAIRRVRRHVVRAARTPATGLSIITRLVLTSAVAAAPSLVVAVDQHRAVRPLAAVVTQPDAIDHPLAAVPSDRTHSPLPESVGPPPPAVVKSPGVLGIPAIALTAYRNADGMMARIRPGCGVSWNLLAGIGYIESTHAFGGATDDRGNAVNPIFGPALDGSLPGNEIIVASRSNGHTAYARAMGPMQFLPSTWTHYAADGNGDGQADPQNIFDATLAAARYLCSGALNLRDRSQLITAVLRYNNSMAYTHNVLGWAQAYATGVSPGALPPITGPARPVAVRTVSAPTTGSPTDSAPTAPQQRGPGETTGTPASGGITARQDGGSSARQNNGNADAGPSTPRSGSSSSAGGSGATTSTGGIRTGSSGGKAGNATSPRVKVGNGRTGGAR